MPIFFGLRDCYNICLPVRSVLSLSSLPEWAYAYMHACSSTAITSSVYVALYTFKGMCHANPKHMSHRSQFMSAELLSA